MNRKHAFISYRRTNGTPWAMYMLRSLQERGFDAFLDTHNIQNEDFAKRIEREIENSDNFILLLTHDIFASNREIDFVEEEISYAKSKGKNMIFVAFDSFNDDAEFAHLEEYYPDLAWVRNFNHVNFNNSSPAQEKASINDVIRLLRDEKGHPYGAAPSAQSGSWYSDYVISDEDLLWMTESAKVCMKLDHEVLKKAINDTPLSEKEELSLFCYTFYDVKSYYKRYCLGFDSIEDSPIRNVYGFVHKGEIEEAESLFGKGHFKVAPGEDETIPAIKQLLKENHLKGFDIIDFTLILKDMKKPVKQLNEIRKFLHKEGGVCFIRELDDSFCMYYPDNEGYIASMMKLFKVDKGAGNRMMGRKIYNMLLTAGADKVYISDSVVSTANHKKSFNEAIFDGYFSYLVPEIRHLYEEDKENDRYAEAYQFLNEHYEDAKNLFRSNEFYFRAGFISGYGWFDEEEE